MIKDPNKVRELLHRKVRDFGCCPYYDLESACDHNIDWLVISRDEFHSIVRRAIAERLRIPVAA